MGVRSLRVHLLLQIIASFAVRDFFAHSFLGVYFILKAIFYRTVFPRCSSNCSMVKAQML